MLLSVLLVRRLRLLRLLLALLLLKKSLLQEEAPCVGCMNSRLFGRATTRVRVYRHLK